MTTILGAEAARRLAKSVAFAGMIAISSLGLAGCETGGSLLGTAGPAAPNTELAAPAAATPSSGTKLSLAPVIGAPENVAQQMQTSLSGALAKQNIAIAQNASEQSDYTVRGYVVSAREKSGVKVSYIWDLTTPTGQRVNRITGEEIVATASGRDPWASVSPQVIDAISGKTASQIASWLPGQAAGGAAAPAATPVAARSSAAPTRTAAASRSVTQPGTTTGSISGPTNAIVPNVTGAPGDGRISLTTALQRELSRKGLSLTQTPGANTYRVEGVVAVGGAKDGKQPIKIDWHVKKPNGEKVGTVSQKNEIQAGSLDGAWGATADAAAAAAAQGILKLLPGKN